ncbi:hypothetical protein SE17_00135 [Kouleothrix aurantiaca]|uniref:Uncharacterized protein n=1 Tax=Kouleothrix aurantiaca TaxID=186479 RepID=A0A0P9HJ49_9CHLR|nr:hypothetical protein SE17_00135 [Kouleothrix aurantiaca]
MCFQCQTTPEGGRLRQALEQASIRHAALQERDRQNQVNENNPPPDTAAVAHEQTQAQDAYQTFHNQYIGGASLRACTRPSPGRMVSPMGAVQHFPGAGGSLNEDDAQ